MLYNAVKSYFYPRSPCGERPLTPARMSSRLPISIHALLAESDNSSYGALDGASISIHALLAESDWQAGAMQLPTAPFLSTLSLRRATAAALLLGKNYVKFLSTLSLRRATYSVIFKISPLSNFYPRSPCGERQFLLFAQAPSAYFYPRSPCGERHIVKSAAALGDRISIHALLAESDAPGKVPLPFFIYFYPRSPCGERLTMLLFIIAATLFLSTLSLRRATVMKWKVELISEFLSTLSLRRATPDG